MWKLTPKEICAILMIFFGTMILNNEVNGHNIQQGLQAQQMALALIIIGSIVLLISFFGCCGAIKESYCMTMTYSTMLFVLLLAQIVMFVIFWINKAEFVESMGRIVDKAWDERTNQASVMDAVQLGLKCCGKNGPLDYVARLGAMPSTCCENNDCSNPLKVYVSGCRSKMTELWSGKSEAIKYTGLVVVCIEVIGFIFGCTLANNIRNYKRRAAY